jgi:hypothetical protein
MEKILLLHHSALGVPTNWHTFLVSSLVYLGCLEQFLILLSKSEFMHVKIGVYFGYNA